ncbi:hypothetical protein ACQP2E_04575 [Actinoplanes sp. CA-015351]|uniref:hypothetical protein n=1 Tax=Actinoplanes sp. CA-015351 TaxID=3239897 RepID=UPI003D9A0315
MPRMWKPALVQRGAGIGRCFQLFHADFGASIARVATVYGIALGVVGTAFLVTTYADMRARRESFSTAYLMAG